MKVLITGGAGFIGANLAVSLSRRDGFEVTALDNLRRAGSELNLTRLAAAGVEFVRGDVREPGDLEGAGGFDALVECSAEPSVLAATADTSYSFETNLAGAFNCLEAAGRQSAFLVFLSTSRVDPLAALSSLDYADAGTRFELSDDQPHPGASREGVAESFPLEGARTFYGATKLAAELLITEYADALGLRAVIDRCGVIAGPWQMGRVDQGVFSWWLLSHLFDRGLSYIGFGGQGKQVRDLLHVEDLIELIEEQLADPARWAGRTLNVGGGRDVSLSLRETTELCRELTGASVPVGPAGEERPGDLRIYLSDCRALHALTAWRPQRDARTVLADTLEWIADNETAVRAALG